MADQILPVFGAASPPPVPWRSVIKIWWLMTWRATLGSLLTGAVLGVILAIIGLILHWPPLTRTLVIFGFGSVVGLAWRIVAVRMALDKKYSDFRLNISRVP